jgi:GH24 family phage-related lysozyme (muramidase)
VKRLVFAASVALLVAGCGGHASRHAALTSGVHEAPPAATLCNQPANPKAGSACTPEGARGADRTHFVKPGEPKPTLTGSSIRIDAAGVRFIAAFENVVRSTYCPYWDPYGHVATRGFGETDWADTFGHRCISLATAYANVDALMERQYQYAVRGLGVSLNQNQIAALDSFVWNLGPGSMQWQPLRSQLQHHNPYGLLAYVRAGGVTLSGLVARRRAEVRKFLEPAHECTGACLRRQRRAQLARDQARLVTLRKRKRSLEHALVANHCKPHTHRHKCVAWVHKAVAVHREGLRLDGEVARLKRELR